MRLPQRAQAAAAERVDEIGGDVGQRLEHEGVAQFRARDAQVAGAFDDTVAVEHHVDVQGAVAETRTAAVAAMRVFQRMQPCTQHFQLPLGVQRYGIVQEGRAVESDRRGAVGRGHHDRAETLAQRSYRGGQMLLRAHIAAQAEEHDGHAIFAHAAAATVNG